MVAPTRSLVSNDAQPQSLQQGQLRVMEKNEAEVRLEKLLFGDETTFLDSLTAPTNQKELVPVDQEERGGSLDGDDAEDEELFFLDAGRSDFPQSTIVDAFDQKERPESTTKEPAWLDSDDERLVVSLASDKRLRKLRDTENDDIITGTEYIRRLRRQFERLHPTPEWVKYARKTRKLSVDKMEAESDSDMSVDDDDPLPLVQPISQLLRSTEFTARSGLRTVDGDFKRRLRPEVIDIQRLKDVTGVGPSSIDSMQFHPYFPLILSAGPSSTVNLYHISPQSLTPNPLVTSLHLRNMPLHTAAFCNTTAKSQPHQKQSSDATRIFISSRRRYFHTWCLATGVIQKISRPMYGSHKREQRTTESFAISPCGRYMGLIGSGKKGGGTVNVLSTESMQWICACRVDSREGVADFSWWRNGNGFAAVGKNGEVSEYDIEQKKVVYRWLDEGAVGATTIALGGAATGTGPGGSRWVAVGSSSGFVNVYDRGGWSHGSDHETKTLRKPKPMRTFDQLTTPTSHLVFSHDGQMLVASSRWKKDALRLIHLPSCTVYRNWPTDKTPLGRVSSIALSRDGQYLAVGNEQGKIKLFQIRD